MPFKRLHIETATRDQLIAHIDELEDMLEDLLPKHDDAVRFQIGLGLTRQQALLVAALVNGRIWSTDNLRTAISIWHDDVSETHTSVVIHSARRKLRKIAVTIENVYAQGWRIKPDCLAKLQAVKIDERPPFRSRTPVPRGLRGPP